ncbi:MAG: DnaA regulatory inactivator Hda [Methylophaga sp.]|nr:MAG: DnaA regulatory inactivator Hda [Methylophaga sp.]
MAQIPLRLNLQQLYKLSNYYFSRPELAEVMTIFSQLKKINFLYLWGNQSSGKTHLLLAMAENAQKDNKRALYLPLAELVGSVSPEVLESVEDLDLLCIDDLDALADLTEWEEALFHCFNRLQHTGCKLLVASQHNPVMTSIKLADLRSRLAAGLVYQLETLNDDDKHQMLMLQAQSRGLKLPEEVAQYLLRHHSRDTTELMVLLKTLDSASMVEKRRLTIPFVRQTLANG